MAPAGLRRGGQSGGEPGLEGRGELDDTLGLAGGVAGLLTDGVVALGVDMGGAIGFAVDEFHRVGDAKEISDAAEKTGAEVRLLKAAELAPQPPSLGLDGELTVVVSTSVLLSVLQQKKPVARWVAFV